MAERSEYFRLLDLPRELRDRIYELALEPRAIFHHSRRDQVGLGYQQPRGLATQRGSHEEKLEQRVKDIFSKEDFIAWRAGLPLHYSLSDEPEPTRNILPTSPYLVFRVVSVTTPLLLVSTAIHAEVKNYLQLHETRFIHEYDHEIASTIFAGDTIVLPSPLFRNIWSRSTLVFDHATISALQFMLHLPVRLAEEAQTVVFASHLVKRIALSTGLFGCGWNIETGKEQSSFRTWLDRLLPKLKSVAVWLPTEIEDTERYKESVPIEMCDMLQSGRLDVVRFYYTSLSDYVTTDSYFLVGSGLSEYRPTLRLNSTSEECQRWKEIDAEFDDDQNCRQKNRVHSLNVVEEVLVNPNVVVDGKLDGLWKLLNAKRVVKLTRRRENDESTAS